MAAGVTEAKPKNLHGDFIDATIMCSDWNQSAALLKSAHNTHEDLFFLLLLGHMVQCCTLSRVNILWSQVGHKPF